MNFEDVLYYPVILYTAAIFANQVLLHMSYLVLFNLRGVPVTYADSYHIRRACDCVTNTVKCTSVMQNGLLVSVCDMLQCEGRYD